MAGFVSNSTIDKLILLYVLDKMEMALTENSILEICSSQNNWLNWMDCKELLAQLLASKLVYKPDSDSAETRYTITPSGRGCISDFYTRIPKSIRDNIDVYTSSNKMYYKRNQEYVSKSYKNDDGSYTIELKILEPETANANFLIRIKIDSRDTAMNACKKWTELAPQIFEQIYTKIIE